MPKYLVVFECPESEVSMTHKFLDADTPLDAVIKAGSLIMEVPHHEVCVTISDCSYDVELFELKDGGPEYVKWDQIMFPWVEKRPLNEEKRQLEQGITKLEELMPLMGLPGIDMKLPDPKVIRARIAELADRIMAIDAAWEKRCLPPPPDYDKEERAIDITKAT